VAPRVRHQPHRHGHPAPRPAVHGTYQQTKRDGCDDQDWGHCHDPKDRRPIQTHPHHTTPPHAPPAALGIEPHCDDGLDRLHHPARHGGGRTPQVRAGMSSTRRESGVTRLFLGDPGVARPICGESGVGALCVMTCVKHITRTRSSSDGCRYSGVVYIGRAEVTDLNGGCANLSNRTKPTDRTVRWDKSTNRKTLRSVVSARRCIQNQIIQVPK
jgi:hypothetical protein